MSAPTSFAAAGKAPRRNLRILLATMQWDYGKREQGLSFEHQTFFPALDQWQRTAALRHFDFVALAQRHGVARMSAMLREEVDQFAPDLLVGVWFEPSCDPHRETLAEIGRRTPCVTLGWFCDSHWRYESFDRPWSEHLDLAVTTSRQAWERGQRDGLGERYLRSQWGAAPGYRRFRDVRRDLDVTFVGQPHGDRAEHIAALRRAGLAVATFGTGFERRLSFEEMVAVFNRSKVNLNFANSYDGSTTQIKARVFEVGACGGYLLSGDAEDLAEYYLPGREIDVFTSEAELVDKARRALADDTRREALAAAAWQRTQREHGLAGRFERLLVTAGVLAGDPVPGGAAAESSATSAVAVAKAAEDGIAATSRALPRRRTRRALPGVSVVTCVYENSRFLPAALRSCLAQEVETEVLVVDDASPEPLAPAAQALIDAPGVRLLRRRRRGGLAAARNTGIAAARHELVIPLDADDFFYPGALWALVEGLDEADVAYGNMTDGGQLALPVTAPLSGEHFLARNPLFCTSLFRRRWWAAVGGYEVRRGSHYEDWNFWARLFRAGCRFHYVPALIYNHTTRPGSMLRQLAGRSEEMARAAVAGVFT
ncbi:MAG: glycosyltransferase [Thermoanaerobaculia bacterium]|nr:glycosyltransferase [Thermoanaerobaculia bacterium]